MVVIVSREGQLANRILHTSNFIVNSKEHHYNVRHLFFEEYYKFFSESLDRNNTSVKFWGKSPGGTTQLFQKAINIFVKILIKLKIRKFPFFELIKYEAYEQGAAPFDLNDPLFIKKAKTKIVLMHGWLFRDKINQNKYKELVLDTWTPNHNFLKNINTYYNKYKVGHDILIGIHVRRGDYKRFEGGKWYFAPEQYYQKMIEISSLKKFEGKKIGFVICTNEKDMSLQNPENLSLFNDQRHFVEDLYLLAKCDYIVGPPSTFSLWASFYGDVPLLMIENVSTTIDDNYFTSNTSVPY